MQIDYPIQSLFPILKIAPIQKPGFIIHLDLTYNHSFNFLIFIIFYVPETILLTRNKAVNPLLPVEGITEVSYLTELTSH